MRVMQRILRTLLVFILLAAAGFAAEDFAEIKKKAEAGSADEQRLVGWLYLLGANVPKDSVEALKWFRKAVNQGYAAAQYDLAGFYYGGAGMPKNDAEAARLYRMAAEQGHPGSQLSLGVMYWKGEGVLKDFVQAHAWINISVAKGKDGAKYMMSRLEEEMTPEQKAEAMKLAKKLWENLPKG